MATDLDGANKLFIRGNILFNDGEIEDAKKYFKEATISNPQHVQAWCALVAVLKGQGNLESAVTELRKGLSYFPTNSEMHYELGGMLRDSDKLAESLESYSRAVTIAPDFSYAWCNLGLVHQQLGGPLQARKCLIRALEIQNTNPMFWFNLGNIERDLENWVESEACYRKAIDLAPDLVDGYFNLGSLLFKLGREVDACWEYERGLSVLPTHVPTLYNWACIRQTLGELIQALTGYERVLSIEPNHSPALHNLGTVLKDLGRMFDAQERYRQALEVRPGDASIWSSHLFGLNYVPETDPERSLGEAKKFGELVASKAKAYQDWEVEACPTKLRVGLVSGDLGQHPVGYFLEGFLKHVDPMMLELIAFETQYRQDSLNTRLRQSIKTWHNLAGMDDESAASFIRAQGIHVLLDLSGHTAHNRLPVFAWRPAPVQASWLGYFATTGVREMDYLIADGYSLPADQEKYFTEKIWRLPETRLCFSEPEEQVEVGTLPAREHGQVTLGCFNNLTKMNEEVVRLWSKVLHALPQSRLFLKAKQINDMHFKDEVIARYAAHGIDEDRLVLEGSSSRQEYLEAYNRVDFALDPFPFPGGTTTAEALWMGVPVLTLQGDSFLSRQGAGLLIAAGLPDWVCTQEAEYVEKAVKYAEGLGRLEKIRSQLRAQVLKSPLFDGRRFAGFFASALHGMWDERE